MEIFFIVIVLIVVGIFVFGYINNKKNAIEYKNALQYAMNAMDDPTYKDSDLYKKRMKSLEKKGWGEVSYNLRLDLRKFMQSEDKVSQSFFKQVDVLNDEDLYLMKYAVIHERVFIS